MSLFRNMMKEKSHPGVSSRKFAMIILVSTAMISSAAADNAENARLAIEVCEEEDIRLKLYVGNTTVTKSKIYRNGIGEQYDLMIWKLGKLKKIDPRVKFHDATDITFQNATLDDNGIYNIHASFNDEEPMWYSTMVNVLKDCPKRIDFYSPPITFREDNGPLQPMPQSGILKISDYTTQLTINVSIPFAIPPVTCSIVGTAVAEIQCKGTENPWTYCHRTFHHLKNSTIKITLKHDNVHPYFHKLVSLLQIDAATNEDYCNNYKIAIVCLALLVFGTVIVIVVLVVLKLRGGHRSPSRSPDSVENQKSMPKSYTKNYVPCVTIETDAANTSVLKSTENCGDGSHHSSQFPKFGRQHSYSESGQEITTDSQPAECKSMLSDKYPEAISE